MNNSALSESARFVDETTLDTYERPVVAPDGWTYDLGPLVTWLKQGKKFLPKTRQEVTGTIVLIPNFALAKDMVDEKTIKEIPFQPGITYLYRPDRVSEPAVREAAQSKELYKLFSMINCLGSLGSCYIAACNLGVANHLVASSIIFSSCSVILSAYSAYKIKSSGDEYGFRGIVSLNLAFSFFTAMSNVSLFTYLSAFEAIISAERLFLLASAPKTIYDAFVLFNEAKKYDFYGEPKQAMGNKVIEIV